MKEFERIWQTRAALSHSVLENPRHFEIPTLLRIEDMADDWVEDHMKDVTVAAARRFSDGFILQVVNSIGFQPVPSCLLPTCGGKWSKVIGNVDSGKSTLVGVLTKGGLDDGRGLARAKVHCHVFMFRFVSPCFQTGSIDPEETLSLHRQVLEGQPSDLNL